MEGRGCNCDGFSGDGGCVGWGMMLGDDGWVEDVV